jgi:hypothetical protein
MLDLNVTHRTAAQTGYTQVEFNHPAFSLGGFDD